MIDYSMLNKYELIFQFESKWDIKSIVCDVKYSESYPLNNISYVFLSIINSNDGKIDRVALASILGFNIADDLDGDIKRYKDDGEELIFNNFVNFVSSWGLIKYLKCNKIIQITPIGEVALETGLEYKFFSARKELLVHRSLSTLDSEDNLFYPFDLELGISTEVQASISMKYSDVSVETWLNVEKSTLIKRLEKSTAEVCNYFDATETTRLTLSSVDISIDLYKNGNDYIPVIIKSGKICHALTELILQESSVKSRKIEEGLYKKLLSDPTTILDYNSIIPFADILDVGILIKDARLKWDDNELFNYIVDLANGDNWSDISKYCSESVIIEHLEVCKNHLDWIAISQRLNLDFIFEHTSEYPWFFDVIIEREDVTIETIKRLILTPELSEEEWDWSEIMPRLDLEFVISNIECVNFDLFKITKDAETEVYEAILAYPSKRWNWAYISESYEIGFILSNIELISNYINIETLIDRASKDEVWSKRIVEQSDIFISILKRKEIFSVNGKNYRWSPKLVFMFEQSGHLVWASNRHHAGFECNSFLPWNEKVFALYSDKVCTSKGFTYISTVVKDAGIILNNPLFNWDWCAISRNYELMNNLSFVSKVFDKLDIDNFIKIAEWGVIESTCLVKENLVLIEQSLPAREEFTLKAPLEFVKANFSFLWDWCVLTRKFFDTLKMQSLGDARWIDKWDWEYLSTNLNINSIVEYLNIYESRWNWSTLTSRLSIETIKENLPEYAKHWDWITLIKDRLSKDDLSLEDSFINVATSISDIDKVVMAELWQVITRKFNYSELEAMIAKTAGSDDLSVLCHWDYNYFYSLEEFKIAEYLKDYCDCVSWDELSQSELLRRELHYDNNISDRKTWRNYIIKEWLGVEDYLWNFRILSKVESITNSSKIIKDKRLCNKDWDWSHITEFAYFLRKGTDGTVISFQNELDFKALSKRIDTELSSKCVELFSNKPWDWNALTSNKSISLSVEFMLSLSDKPWNWNALSYRDIELNEDIIARLVDKDIDWEYISARSDFIPSNKTLDILVGQTLNWDAISRSKHIEIKKLDTKYYNFVDWYYLSSQAEFPLDLRFLRSILERDLNWSAISGNDQFELSIDVLSELRDCLDWNAVNKRLDTKITVDMIDEFADILNWTNVSRSQEFKFTNQLIEKYETKWDWVKLVHNSQIQDSGVLKGEKYKSKLNCVEFIDRFNRPSPKIYHFTHLFNAVEIIKSRRIQSRHRAEGRFANAAGNLVDRRDTAHSFARFYYRSKTPTQFYNECLGMDSTKRYYSQAQTLGLPKCPMPVFFEFDLKEVIAKMADKCYYSTGNMQTNWAQVKKITDSPSSLNIDYLYSSIRDGVAVYKNYSQQEFLVDEEFDFRMLDSFRIICFDDEQANLLREMLGDDCVCSKISTDNIGIYHKDNRQLYIHNSDNSFELSFDYKDNASFILRCSDTDNIDIINTNNVLRSTKTEIEISPNVKIVKTDVPFEVYFVDRSINKREWLIYKNKNNEQYN